MMDLSDILAIYQARDGQATRALYDRLEALGPAGHIAVNLFRAAKNSERAKEYRRGASRHAAYDTKQWALGNLDAALCAHADACGIAWGWGEDAAQPFHKWVLYVDLLSGQVSFHTHVRGNGPAYPGAWDGARQMGPTRIARFIAALFATAAQEERFT